MRYEIGSRLSTTPADEPQAMQYPFISESGFDANNVRLLAPPPKHGSIWSNGQVKVKIKERFGITMVVFCAPWSRWPQLGTSVLYCGSLVGAAKWLLETGFEVVS